MKAYITFVGPAGNGVISPICHCAGRRESEEGKWVSTFSYLMLAIKGLSWKVLIIVLVEVVDRRVT